jgi:hypothetical protein
VAKRDTANFLRLMNEQNERIAAREAAEKREVEEVIGRDNIRETRMEEHREKWDHHLRARPRTRNRPRSARIIRGHMENPGAEDPGLN